MPAFRCSMCNVDYPLVPPDEKADDGWPTDDKAPCCLCDEPVDAVLNCQPQPVEDIHKRIAHHRYELWCFSNGRDP